MAKSEEKTKINPKASKQNLMNRKLEKHQKALRMLEGQARRFDNGPSTSRNPPAPLQNKITNKKSNYRLPEKLKFLQDFEAGRL